MYCKIMILTAAAAFFAAPAAGRQPADAAAATAAEAPGEAFVEIPFAPPLGRTLRYRLVRERIGRTTPQRHDVNFDISFRRSGADYVMSVRLILPPNLPPPDAASAIARVFTRPTEYRVSAQGEMLELLDLEGHWRDGERALAELGPALGMDPRAREAAEAMVRQIRAMPPEAQLELFARHIAPVIAAAGGAYPLEGALTAEESAQSLMGAIQQSASVHVTGVDERVVRLSQRSSVSSAELEAQMRSLIASVGPPQQDPSQFRIISNDLVETYEVSRRTGLTERFRAEKVVVSEVNGERSRGVETITLELVR